MDQIGKLIEPVAPLLRQFTHLIPQPLETFGLSLLGDNCYQLLVRQVDFVSSPECIAKAVSKALGLGIVSMSSIVKIPQILKILSARSGYGISLSGLLLETLAQIISTCYNTRSGFPFTSYGETVLIALQNLTIIHLILHYSNKRTLGTLFLILAAVLAYAMANPSLALVSQSLLVLLQSLTIPLGVASKVPQILANFRNKSTGQLSVFAVVNYLAGSLARVFTTLQEVKDPLILTSFILGALLNFALAIQVILYWNPGRPLDSSPRSAHTKPAAARKSRKAI